MKILYQHENEDQFLVGTCVQQSPNTAVKRMIWHPLVAKQFKCNVKVWLGHVALHLAWL